MKKRIYDPNHIGSFETEWGVHKDCREWWYATSVFTDQDNNLYSCQYTMLYQKFGPVTLKTGMIALTDFKNSRHYYLQDPSLDSRKVRISDTEASYQGVATAKKLDDHMELEMTHKDFQIKIHAGYGKGPFWHCDNGRLQMGGPGDKNTTLYYSYTNMPSTAELTLHGKKIALTGKTWFDKQGGSFDPISVDTHWEWFSLRFFDDEEIMIFAFPHRDLFDGTYITRDGQRSRLNHYRLQTLKKIRYGGLVWSSAWALHVDVKDQDYTIEPIQEGHMNFAYFEELCYIKDREGTVVGYAMVELLPGVHNHKGANNEDAPPAQPGEKLSVGLGNLFKRIEF